MIAWLLKFCYSSQPDKLTNKTENISFLVREKNNWAHEISELANSSFNFFICAMHTIVYKI